MKKSQLRQIIKEELSKVTSEEELKVGDKILSNGDVIEITQEMLDYFKRCKTIFGMKKNKLNKIK